MRLSREGGEGVCLYFGRRQGSPFVGFNLGMTGWQLRDGRVWWFCRPTLHVGRLFTDRGRIFRTDVLLVPGWLVDGLRRVRGRA